MNSETLSFNMINEQNSQFWHIQSELTLARLSDKTVFELAEAEMISEAEREVPVRSRKTLEAILSSVEHSGITFQADFARKGGQSRTVDELQVVIEEIVKRRPTITLGQLLFELAGDAGAETVTSIDRDSDVLADEGRKIHFLTHDGRPKTASVSGLKYRLVRAKRKIKEQ